MTALLFALGERETTPKTTPAKWNLKLKFPFSALLCGVQFAWDVMACSGLGCACMASRVRRSRIAVPSSDCGNVAAAGGDPSNGVAGLRAKQSLQ
jgi:hypothetical protein